MSDALLAERFRGERRTLPDLADQLFLDVGDVGAKQSRFWTLLLLATVIATAGVIGDSTATVIGAMIVAPLGTPILATALAIVTARPARLLASLGTVALGVAFVIGVAYVLAIVLPELQPIATNGQITGRTSPSLIDLVAAIATGFAGAYGLARKDVSDVMPGVAIAISLVPPLAVVGITAQGGDFSGALGAFLLFLSNMLAMIVAGSILFTVYGYAREAQTEQAGFRKKSAYAVVGVATVLVVVPLAATTFQTVRQETILTNAEEVARSWAAGTNTTVVGARFDGSDLSVLVEDVDQLPSGDLVAEMAGSVPAGTPVVLNRVSGERIDLGEVPGG